MPKMTKVVKIGKNNENIKNDKNDQKWFKGIKFCQIFFNKNNQKKQLIYYIS